MSLLPLLGLLTPWGLSALFAISLQDSFGSCLIVFGGFVCLKLDHIIHKSV